MIGLLLDEFERLSPGAGRRARRRWRFGRGVQITGQVQIIHPRFIKIGDRAVINECIILQS